MRINISINLASSLSHLITTFISVSGIGSSSHSFIASVSYKSNVYHPLFLYHVIGCRNPWNINSSVLGESQERQRNSLTILQTKTVSQELEITQDPLTIKVTTMVYRDSLLPACWRNFQIRDKLGASFLKIPLGKEDVWGWIFCKHKGIWKTVQMNFSWNEIKLISPNCI